MRLVMGGIRRSIGTASRQQEPVTAETLAAMFQHLPDTLTGKHGTGGQRPANIGAEELTGSFHAEPVSYLPTAVVPHRPPAQAAAVRPARLVWSRAGRFISGPPMPDASPTQPCTVRALEEAFVVVDAASRSVAYVYFAEGARRSATGRWSREEARSIAERIARGFTLAANGKGSPGDS